MCLLETEKNSMQYKYKNREQNTICVYEPRAWYSEALGRKSLKTLGRLSTTFSSGSGGISKFLPLSLAFFEIIRSAVYCNIWYMVKQFDLASINIA